MTYNTIWSVSIQRWQLDHCWYLIIMPISYWLPKKEGSWTLCSRGQALLIYQREHYSNLMARNLSMIISQLNYKGNRMRANHKNHGTNQTRSNIITDWLWKRQRRAITICVYTLPINKKHPGSTFQW